MSDTDELWVSFGVVNFHGTPDLVTETVGIEPSRTWVKGESYGDNGAVRTHSRWELASPASPSTQIEVQLDCLLDLLETRAASVHAVADQFECGLSIAGYFRQSFNPAFHISAEATRRIAELGLSMDVDLYVLDGTTS